MNIYSDHIDAADCPISNAGNSGELEFYAKLQSIQAQCGRCVVFVLFSTIDQLINEIYFHLGN